MDEMVERAYTVDRAGFIRRVDPGWDAFARANDGESAVAARVLGRHLFEFVSGGAVKHVFSTLMSRVIRTGEPVEIPFRCDAPEARRSLQMRIERGPDDCLVFTTRTLDEGRRPRVPLLDRSTARSPGEHLCMCSWCKRVRAGEDWLEVEEAVRRLGLFEDAQLPDVTHGLCPACERTIAPLF